MKILLLADANSVWNTNFVRFCLLRKGVELIVFSENLNDVPPQFYEMNNVKCFSYLPEEQKNMRSFNMLKRYSIRKKYLKVLEKYGTFDVINVQFVTYGSSWMALQLARKNTKVIFSYWGSDLFRALKLNLYRMRGLVRKVQYVTFDNIDLQMMFEKVYSKVFKGKKCCAYFGLPILEMIDNNFSDKTKEQLREQLEIDQDKIVIAVGYNGYPAQQHIPVIEELGKLSTNIKKNIVILLQMTYGGSEEYKQQVIQKVEETGFSKKVFLKFLSDDEVANIRMITDIYVNAQKTDAFSGSVCENLYAQNVVLNAKWLKYEELDKYNIQYLEFSEFQDISHVLEDYLNGKLSIDTSVNREKIEKLRSWKYCVEKWNHVLYEK